MAEFRLHTSQLKGAAPQLKAGDRVLLSGVVYTARDAAHKRLFQLMEQGSPLPIPIDGSVIFYAGPTPARSGHAVGSCGPTTSSRMDPYAPKLLDMGLAAMIGKGGRSEEVRQAIVRNGALYLCAVGGAGALVAESILSARELAFQDLGCESIKAFEIENMPLFVGIDSHGNSIFDIG